MQILKNISLALAFLLELIMIVVIGYYAFLQGETTFSKWIISMVSVAAAITL